MAAKQSIESSHQTTEAYTRNAELSLEKKKDIVNIPIVITADVIHDRTVVVSALYAKQEKMRDVLNAMKKAAYPLSIDTIYNIEEESFTCYVSRPEDKNKFLNKSITDYDRGYIVQEGLKVYVDVVHHHKIKDVGITCPYMLKDVACPILDEVREKESYTEKNYQHLCECTHFADEFADKPECKENADCETFKRMEKGGNRLDDRCHFKLWRHPPRVRNINLAENTQAFLMNTGEKKDNHDVHQPTKNHDVKYRWNEKDGWLKALITEVTGRGFKSDLCLECGPKEQCPHNGYSLLTVVDEKMKHHRHQTVGCPLRRDEMLALVLYTGCECNYDLCRSQRNGDYKKWKWFDLCLWNAITKLSLREKGAFSVYSGLSKVNLPKKSVENGYFVTYISTSWNKKVSENFMGDDGGMIIQFDAQFKEQYGVKCCDVSWISKFGDECEVLFARSINRGFAEAFQCEVVDDGNGIQTVMLKLK